jgi:Na+/H+-dicarboxylate symporter
LVPFIEPIGTLWVNAIRMTVIPLVAALLITGITSASAQRVGRMGAQSIGLFLFLLACAALFTAIVAPFAFRPLSLDPASTAALRANAHQTPNPADLSWTNWLISLIPVNPIKAAADSALLPLIVFTVIFSLALTRLDAATRAPIVRLFQTLADALIIVVRWVLVLTPLGVFALAFVVSARVGSGNLGAALGYYVALGVVLMLVFGVGLYLFAALGGRVPLRTFARAVFPAQVVAFTSRSSLTALPALIEGARDVLRLPVEVTGFVLPFAISVFKVTSPIYWTLGALFVGKLYGIDLAPSQLATIAAASIALNASTPGIPSGGLLIQAPVYAAIGLPVEGIGILIAIDAIPDMFKSAFIVASDMAVAVVVARWNHSGAEAAATAARF